MSLLNDSTEGSARSLGATAHTSDALATENVAAPRQEGSPVTPLLLISGPTDWRTLLMGIDSLYVTLYVNWHPEWPELLAALAEGKAKAQNTEGVLWDYLPGKPMVIMPRGMPMYGYQLRHCAGAIYISEKENADSYPNVYASISSEKLWHLGHRVCLESVSSIVESLGGRVDRIQVSRLDLTADMHVPDGLTLSFLQQHKVTRSRKSNLHLDEDQLETFYSGSANAPIRLRVYDKSREILHSGKVWFFDLWKVETALSNVWRVEFQMRRPALRDFAINTLDDLATRLGGVWTNLTSRWFSLRLHDNENRTRCTVHPWWQAVQQLAGQLGSEIMIERRRKPNTIADASRCVRMGSGLVAAYAARMGLDDVHKAIEGYSCELLAYWYDKGFAARYAVNRLKLGFDDSPEVQS